MEADFTAENLRRMSDADVAVADNEPDVRGWTVIAATDRPIGEVDDLIVDTDAMKVRYLQLDPDESINATDDVLYVPIDRVDIDRSRKRVVLRGAADLSTLAGLVPADFTRRFAGRTSDGSADVDRGSTDARRMTRAEEEVEIGKRPVEVGEVRVGKHVETEHRREQVPVTRDQVHVERRPVHDGSAGEIRAAEGEIRVPVVEEEVVVEKRPVVKEELIVSKERVEESRPVDVEVRKEVFDVDRKEDRRGER